MRQPLLCERHHKAKDDGRWKAQLNADRSVTWTSPTGRTYTVPAATYPTDGTAPMCVPNDNSQDGGAGHATQSGVVVPHDNPRDSGTEHARQAGIVVPDDNPAEARSIASPPNVDDVA